MKYGTAKELSQAMDTYFSGISYQEPAVVATPTGEVDKHGKPVWTTRLLTAPAEQPGGIGKPMTVTKWLSPPSVAGLCLALGISRDTWCRYAQKAALRAVCEGAKLKIEEYWVSALKGKSANGAKFALTNCFGWSGAWRERQAVGDEEREKSLRLEIGPELGELAK